MENHARGGPVSAALYLRPFIMQTVNINFIPATDSWEYSGNRSTS